MAVTTGRWPSQTGYIGLSTDVKPSGVVDFAATFYEYDTGKTYIWTGSEYAQTAPLSPDQPPIGSWVEYFPGFNPLWAMNDLGVTTP